MKYKLDTEKSKINWKGSLEDKRQHGEVYFKSGSILTEGHKITGGEVLIDMQTIKVSEELDKDNREMLARHLKSKDFFEVNKYPVCDFRITGEQKADGRNNVQGKLMLKGIAFELEIPSQIEFRDQYVKSASKFTLKEVSPEAYQFMDGNYGEGKEMPQIDNLWPLQQISE